MSAPDRDELLDLARRASALAYAPYSGFHVGAVLQFADGSQMAAGNVENASYGLTLCAETVAVGAAMQGGLASPLVAVAIHGGRPGADGIAVAAGSPVTPCGRCRQMLEEVASQGGTDPLVWCAGENEVLELRLSALLPYAFDRDNLQG
jgi:cytidine deaminase